jgi:hypothetical protein
MPAHDLLAVVVLICAGDVSGQLDQLDVVVSGSWSCRLLGLKTLVDLLTAVLAHVPLCGLMAVASGIWMAHQQKPCRPWPMLVTMTSSTLFSFLAAPQ